VAPVRVDILTSLPGCPSFASLWRKRIPARFGVATANYLSLQHLIQSKEAAGRPQDLADLHILKKVQAR